MRRNTGHTLFTVAARRVVTRDDAIFYRRLGYAFAAFFYFSAAAAQERVGVTPRMRAEAHAARRAAMASALTTRVIHTRSACAQRAAMLFNICRCLRLRYFLMFALRLPRRLR